MTLGILAAALAACGAGNTTGTGGEGGLGDGSMSTGGDGSSGSGDASGDSSTEGGGSGGDGASGDDAALDGGGSGGDDGGGSGGDGATGDAAATGDGGGTGDGSAGLDGAMASDGAGGLDGASGTDGSGGVDVAVDGPVVRGNMVLCGGHVCQCSNGTDDDGDGLADALDPECVSPFDDDESSFATGIPGDNMGANAATECFFDGNSGPGNDRDCVVPNGCDCRGCCDFDVNRNGTRERVNIREEACRVTPSTTTPNVAGGPCTPSGDGGAGSCTGAGLHCLRDGNAGTRYFCTPCSACIFASEETPPIRNCEVNPCATGERCVGDPPPTPMPPPDAGVPDASTPADAGTRPDGSTGADAATGMDATTPRDGSTTPDASTPDVSTPPDSGVPLPVCNGGLTPCFTHPDCNVRGPNYFCITGCCQFLG